MRSKVLASIGAAAALAAAAPSVASAAPVDVVDFTLTPSCVRPGGQVTAHVTLRNTTLSTQNAYAQAWVTVGPWAEVYSSAPEGPYPVPPLATLSQDKAMPIDPWTPPGVYEVHVGVGPSTAAPRSWSQRSTQLTVSYFFC
jgi:hypothetical protein